MADRYKDRDILKNNNEIYKEVFRNRNVKFIRQFETPNFKYPSKDDLNKFDISTYIWQTGDSYYKLAYHFYGDSTAWWVIAKFNNKPTESHVKIGDTIYIPLPLPKVLNYLLG